MHMYATLSMGGSGQSHKKVDQQRQGRLLYLYYNNKVSGDTEKPPGNHQLTI